MIARNAAQGSQKAGLLTSTYAVMFFGTPHSGTKDVSLFQVLSRVNSLRTATNDVKSVDTEAKDIKSVDTEAKDMKSVDTETNNQVLQHLKEHSEALEDIQRLYLQASAGLRTIYFYEEYPTVIGGDSTNVSVSK